MNKIEFQQMRRFLATNESGAWERIWELRREFEESYNSLFANLHLRIESVERAVLEGIAVIQNMLTALGSAVDFGKADPGHSLGHLVRDYLHALVLSENGEISPEQVYIGMIAGALHDILGCTLVDRYSEGRTAVRHAEAGGLLFLKLAQDINIDQKEALLAYYAIAAHTHYLEPSRVKCFDGVEREILPYRDTDSHGKPIMSIWLTRWTDRLDANGPCFVGRHFLTLVREHNDYGTGKYSPINFYDHMRPLLRSEEEIRSDSKGRTMREHLMMYIGSQNNNSPYGRFDSGMMTTLREAYKERVLRIIASFDSPVSLSGAEEGKLVSEWIRWLSEKIEPSEPARRVSSKLGGMFSASTPRN